MAIDPFTPKTCLDHNFWKCLFPFVWEPRHGSGTYGKSVVACAPSLSAVDVLVLMKEQIRSRSSTMGSGAMRSLCASSVFQSRACSFKTIVSLCIYSVVVCSCRTLSAKYSAISITAHRIVLHLHATLSGCAAPWGLYRRVREKFSPRIDGEPNARIYYN
jgi:hypothetical protein